MSDGLLAGRRLLVTGVLNRRSIAFAVAAAAQRHGARVVLSSPPQIERHTRRAASQLADPPQLVALDVTAPETVAPAIARAEELLGGLDGAVHAIAFGARETVGGGFVGVPATAAAEAFSVSAHSLALLADATRAPFARSGGGALVGLSFESRFAWPGYNWMGVAKAALESTARYAARELGPQGVRVNVVSAGPIRSFAARSVPGFADLTAAWAAAPLGWDAQDAAPVADACCFLLSPLARAVTGELLHVDGGMHAVVPGDARATSG